VIALQDRLRRRVRYLRVSVTDRCNLRCKYCLPEKVTFRPRTEILDFDEIERLVRLFVAAGVTHVRITGGEPLVRRDLPTLIARIRAIPGVSDLAMTTNAVLLAEYAVALKRAGLERLNVSLDTVDAGHFRDITRGGELSDVIAGLDAADAAGFVGTKLNAVLVRGLTNLDLPALVEFSRSRGALLRLIEYMPIGIDDYWQDARFIPMDEARASLVAAGYTVASVANGHAPVGGGPATYSTVTSPGGASQTVGFVAALTHNFCAGCNRVRLTADGRVRECLSEGGSVSLRDLLRAGATDAELAERIHQSLYGKVEGHGFRAGLGTGGMNAFVPMSSLGG
jgi:cyclic pyranopterin phosphate synthase